MYQFDTIAKTYGTLGYLVTIIAAISLCILPRAKLVQLTIQNLVCPWSDSQRGGQFGVYT